MTRESKRFNYDGESKTLQGLTCVAESLDLVDAAYTGTRKFPKDEMYYLANQIRRAAESVLSNIAEGCARQSTPEFKRFHSIARRAVGEVATELIVTERQG